MAEEDNMSVTTAILGMEYDEEQAIILITNMASGLTVDQAARSGTVMVNKVDSTDFAPVKGVKLSDASNGRRILDCIDSAMQKCGLPLVAAVKSGINLEALAASKQRDNGELDEEIQEFVLLEVMIYVKPEKEFYEAEAKDQFRLAKEVLKMDQNSLHAEDAEKLSEAEIHEKHAELKSIAKEEAEKKYFKELKQYVIKVEKQNEAKAKLSGLRKKQQRNNVMDAVFQALIAAKTAISKKVKEAVKEYPLLIEKLNERIAVRGSLVKDAYNTDNLTGMYGILKNTYGKATLISVNRWLLDSMSMSASMDTLKEKPEHGLNVVLECLKEEEQIKIWEYMTKDMFFTALLLRIYQPSQTLYADIAREAMKFLQQDQVGVNDELTVEEKSMPIFSHLNHYIKDVLVRTKEFAEKNERSTGGLGNSNSSYNKGNYNHNQKFVQKGLELAASASDISTSNENKKITLRMIDNMSFDKEVRRTDLLGFKHVNGRIVLYTATKEPCKQCLGKDKHDIHCYVRSCNKCGLYGHTEPYCKQVVREAHSVSVTLGEEDADDEDTPV